MKEKHRTNSLRRSAVGAVILLSIAGALTACQSGSQEPPRQSVLFITIDTLRADHLGCYGYPRETSPSIDAFAEKSIIFESCVSQSTSTLPSHASIFTSLYPAAHGAIRNSVKLSEDIPSLINVFKNNGFFTGAIVSSVVVEKKSGLDQGFRTYDEKLYSPELNRENYLEKSADLTTEATIEWLRKRKRKPFFLWAHYIDPHGAYYPPRNYREMFLNDEWHTKGEELPVDHNFAPRAIPQYQKLSGIRDTSNYISQYDGEIRFADDQIGRLLQFLEESGLASNTIVVITSDHGESFTERDLCFGHSFRTYDEQAVIPLIISFPDLAVSGRINSQVRAIDIMPTLLDKLDLENPYPIHGQSLMKMITSGEEAPVDFAMTYSEYGAEFFDSTMGAQKSIRTLQWKLTQNSRDGTWELYNLEKDPLETVNLIDREPAVMSRMKELFEREERNVRQAPVREIKLTPKQIKQFDAFGYLAK